ncbi:MAG: prepilin-type N-terminal cleavage/methylation domain-containing protein [Sedimentisphaerales bacterium]|nr:prepilin-type N-terminal cleavage/methylation domain-containing protein [Sedimentisphaerales bacterium]
MCKGKQAEKRGFTLIELLVVVSIIALLISILLPALSRARKQARAAVDLSNLHHWGLATGLYQADNDGKLFSYTYYADWQSNQEHFDAMQDGFFMGAMRKYHDNTEELRLCPEAEKIDLDPHGGEPEWGSTFTAWGNPEAEDTDNVNPIYRSDIGSYCWNAWAYQWSAITAQSLAARGVSLDSSRFWSSAQLSAEVPLLADGAMPDAWPDGWNGWPDYDDQEFSWDFLARGDMVRIAMNRHFGAANVVFGDSSAARVPLLDLWNLRWNPQYERQVDPVRWWN